MNRIKSLDGLRAIAIIMVLLSHSIRTMPKEISENFFYQFISNGHLGVRIFFVISGYLITKLLIAEKERTGSINIKHFYIRRFFRIFPVFYLYILVILVLKYAFFPDIIQSYSDAVPAALYIWNYKHLFIKTYGHASWIFGHLWSLSMEEQFYLLWPFVFNLLYIRTSVSKFTKIVLIAIILMPFLRLLTYYLMPNSRGEIVMMLHTGGDAILIGCFGALVENSITFKAKFIKYLHNKFSIAFTLLFLFVISPLLTDQFKGGYDLSIGISLSNIFILIFIFWCINVPTKFADVLNSKIFIRIGILSYSLYIWQQLVLDKISNTWINKFPLNLAVLTLVAFISYYIIEKPILKLKKRFTDVPQKAILNEAR